MALFGSDEQAILLPGPMVIGGSSGGLQRYLTGEASGSPDEMVANLRSSLKDLRVQMGYARCPRTIWWGARCRRKGYRRVSVGPKGQNRTICFAYSMNGTDEGGANTCLLDVAGTALFDDPEEFRAPSQAYETLPFRHTKLPAVPGQVLVTSAVGEYLFLSENDFHKLTGRTLQPGTVSSTAICGPGRLSAMPNGGRFFRDWLRSTGPESISPRKTPRCTFLF